MHRHGGLPIAGTQDEMAALATALNDLDASLPEPADQLARFRGLKIGQICPRLNPNPIDRAAS
jgi:hypothetical protein